MTLRTSIERPETYTVGTKELFGTDPVNIEILVRKMAEQNWKMGLFRNCGMEMRPCELLIR